VKRANGVLTDAEGRRQNRSAIPDRSLRFQTTLGKVARARLSDVAGLTDARCYRILHYAVTYRQHLVTPQYRSMLADPNEVLPPARVPDEAPPPSMVCDAMLWAGCETPVVLRLESCLPRRFAPRFAFAELAVCKLSSKVLMRDRYPL
jgi:hypothetical protein